MKIWIYACLILAGLLLGDRFVYAQEPSKEEELLATAQRAFEDGFHDVAIRYLEEFVPQFSQSQKIDQARLLLGQCYYFKNEFTKALDQFKSVSDGSKNKDEDFFWIGEAYLKLSDYLHAQENYQHLINSFPESEYIPQALYSLAWSYFDQKQFEQAKDGFVSLVSKFPKHQLVEDADLKIAECIFNLGDYPSAVKAFEKYMGDYPQSIHAAAVYGNLADAYYYMEDFTQAMNAYDKVLKTAQDLKLIQTAMVGRVWCAIKNKSYDQAQKMIKEAMEFSKNKNLSTEDLMLVQSQLMYERADLAGAVDAYSQMLKVFPAGDRRMEAYLGRGNAYYSLKNYDLASNDYKFMLDHQSPDSDQELIEKASLGLGWVYVKQNDIVRAIKCFQTQMDRSERRESKINILVQMGDAYHDAGKLNEAGEVYSKIIRMYPDNNPWLDYVYYRQGIAFLKSDKIESALAVFQDLQTNYPNSKYLEDINYYFGVVEFKRANWQLAIERMEGFLKALTHPSDFAPESNYILALSYLNLKQYEEALKVFQRILRLYPDDEMVAKNSDIGIAKCQFELGQVKEAVKRFKLIAYKYTKTDVELEALLWLAQYAMKNSEYLQAVNYYNEILDHYSENPQLDQIHYELGQAYEVQGQPDQALLQYKAVSVKDPALLSKIKLAIAGIFSKEFDPQKALTAYQNIVATNPEYARNAYLKMAQLYRNTQNYEKEIDVYVNALKTDQSKGSVSNAELLFDIADTYETMGNMESAVEYYLKIPVQYADQTGWLVKAYLRVAKIFEDRKDWEGAKVSYQKIIQLNTDESKYAQERLDLIKKK